MNFVIVGRFALTENLSLLHEILTNQSVLHRFTEEGNSQLLWVEQSTEASVWQAAITEYQTAMVSPEAAKTIRHEYREQSKSTFSSLDALLAVYRFPLTLVPILLGILGYLVVTFEWNGVYQQVTFSTLDWIRQTHEYWRMLTPTFIHFGLLHIVFNGLWLWDLGRRIESYLSPLKYLTLFFATAIFANLLQFVIGGPGHFGGLSGVVYGYFGFLGVAGYYFNILELRIPKAWLGFMFAFLALGFSGLVTAIIGVNLANWAHFAGLITGASMALIMLKNSKKYPHTSNN